jgi:tetratricopeptide (TPR) repeat protein
MGSAALNRGRVHYDLGRHDAALTDLNLALKLGADPVKAHHNLALVHLARRNLAAARASLARALEADPGYPDAKKLRAQIEQAEKK